MMSTHTPIRSMISPLLQSFRSLSLTPSTFALLPRNALKPTTIAMLSSRPFSTTPGMAKKDEKRNKTDPRVTMIRYHMQHPITPRPLRLSRMRALRHWTIHRAWMLARRKKIEAQEGELYRMYLSMHRACEELRNLDPPGTKDSGRLYRIAMEKKGIFGHGGVPIEYARFQVDTPAKEAWNHGWTR